MKSNSNKSKNKQRPSSMPKKYRSVPAKPQETESKYAAPANQYWQSSQFEATKERSTILEELRKLSNGSYKSKISL